MKHIRSISVLAQVPGAFPPFFSFVLAINGYRGVTNADLVHELEIGVAGVGPELDGDFDSGDQGGFVAEGAVEAAARPPAIGRPEFLRLMLFLKN